MTTRRSLYIISLELSENNKGQIYVKNGESYQLEALDQDGNPVDTTLLSFKANDADGNIAVNDSGLVTAVKESTSTNDKTQIRIELKTNPDIYTYINVVVPMSPVIDKLNVANGKTTDYLPEYDGGSISDTASKLYYFNIEGNAEWRNDLDDDNYTKKGLPTIDWYLDGEKVTTTQFDWYRATQHDAGMVNPKTRAEINISTYGEHTVKVVLTGLDGATVEKEIKVNRTPIWLNDNHAVKRITKDAGDVVIPKVVNGYDIIALDASGTNDRGVESGVTSLVIPETVTSISSNFFKTPTDLASIEFKGNVPASENLDLSRMILSEGCLKAPEGQAKAYVEYAKAHNWNKGTSPLSWEELFGLDVKAPVIEGVTEGMLTNKDVTYSSKDTDLDKVILDGKEYTWDNAPKTVTTEGKHTLVVSDKSGNTTTINFTIDKTAPIINASDKQITVGDKFDPKAGVTAKDGDEDLTSSIEVKGSVNTSVAGKYTIVYSVMDEAGNYSAKAITVIVNEKATKPNNNGGTGTWDDGGPFTTDVCGNVFDRWGNKIYSAPACQVSDGYHVPNTGVR